MALKISDLSVGAWVVDVDVLGKSGCAKCYRGAYHAELVDALYDMIVKLKEEELI